MKKRILMGIAMSVCVVLGMFAQQEHKHSTFYEQRASLFEMLPVHKSDIIFLGNSITNGCEWSELFHNKHIKNRGISGDVCEGVYDRLEPMLKGHPAKIFLLIGVNDLGRGATLDSIANGVARILDKIKMDSPRTKVYLQSILPVSDVYGKFLGHTTRWKEVPQLNILLKKVAQERNVPFIDLYSSFVNEEGKMDTKYSNDGLHLLGVGYQKWAKIISKYVMSSAH